LIDKVYRAPLLSSGFRAALARLCLSNLITGNIAFHLFHEKESNYSYHLRRVENAKIFNLRLRELIPDVKKVADQNSFTLELITDFFDTCQKYQVDIERYHTLFDARPRYLVFKKSFWARIRKYLL
jgi:hypothetical protein